MKGQGLLLAIVSVVVAAAVILGFLVMGSPKDARKVELDKRRVEDLKMLSSVMKPAYHQPLKDTLDVDSYTGPAVSSMRDPVTREPYAYHVVDSTHYELCATFDTEVKPEDLPSWEQGWSHPKGRHCFRFSARDMSMLQPESR